MLKNEYELKREYWICTKTDEAAAVYYIRNLVENIDTKGKWIDIIFSDRYYSDYDDKTAFKNVIVELFERKIKPKYLKDADIDLKRAIAWKVPTTTIIRRVEMEPKWRYFWNKRCAECHRKAGEEAVRIGKPYIYTCHAGLIDFAAPILVEGEQIGTILGGQVLTKKPEKSMYAQIAKEIGVDEGGFVESVKKIKIITEKNVTAAAEVLFIVANSLSKIGYEELKLKNISNSLKN